MRFTHTHTPPVYSLWQMRPKLCVLCVLKTDELRKKAHITADPGALQWRLDKLAPGVMVAVVAVLVTLFSATVSHWWREEKSTQHYSSCLTWRKVKEKKAVVRDGRQKRFRSVEDRVVRCTVQLRHFGTFIQFSSAKLDVVWLHAEPERLCVWIRFADDARIHKQTDRSERKKACLVLILFAQKE